MATKPTRVRVRMYQVGFGDCFLLTFFYKAPQKSRHLLIDFGTTEAPDGRNANALLTEIAISIAETVGSDRFSVVATHRHKDHIAGFDPGTNGKGPGAVIAKLKPTFVIQPWTEQPDLAVDAQAPIHLKGLAARRETLASMQAIAQHAVEVALPRLARSFQNTAVAKQLAFIGDDNIANVNAVRNLMTMGKNDYVYAKKKSKLGTFLPGVNVTVLGPPTVKQHAGVRKQRAEDPNEFWLTQAKALGVGLNAKSADAMDDLFPGHEHTSGGSAPTWARWIVHSMRNARGDQLLELVRSLDTTMNNTSVILLFECGGMKFLFPGDAQIENWEYALAQDDLIALLKDVNVYKVGHHGSRNATPKTLWKNWFPAGAKKPVRAERMATFMSTKPGKHGDPKIGTEVPRSKLVTELTNWTRLQSTEGLDDGLYVEETFGE